MDRTVVYTPLQRRLLLALCVVAFVGLNGAFLYGLAIEPALLRAALSNPVSLAFVVEALLLTGVLAALLVKWRVTRLHWGAIVALSLAGSLAFALPIALLWRGGSASRDAAAQE